MKLCFVLLSSLLCCCVFGQRTTPRPRPSVPADEGADRFPGPASCLGVSGSSPGAIISCLSELRACSTRVTVVASGGEDCSQLQQDQLDGMRCSKLEDVIRIIECPGCGDMGPTCQPPSGDCIEILLQPTQSDQEPHKVLASEGRCIWQNVVFTGVSSQDQVRVAFVPEGGGAPPVMVYSLRFSNQFTVLSGLELEGSPGALAFDTVDVVAIENCDFRFFSRGAVDAYNSRTVLIHSTNFSHNQLNNLAKEEAYRGHSAGLSIAYNQEFSGEALEPQVDISYCVFRNNSVDSQSVATTFDSNRNGFAPEDALDPSSPPPPPPGSSSGGDGLMLDRSEQFEARGQLFGNQILTGRGGGVAIIVNSNVGVAVNVTKCLFQENSAAEFGGGMYTLLQGPASHLLTISASRFVKNVSPSTGGGLYLTFVSEDTDLEASEVRITGNEFVSNRARFGGGVFFLPLTLSLLTSENLKIGVGVVIQECDFTENTAIEVGAGVGVAFSVPSASQEGIQPLEIRDCLFVGNLVNGAGVVSIANYPATFLGNNFFLYNFGASLSVIGALVRVYDVIEFRGNVNERSLDGGALYVTTLGQLEFQPRTRLLFTNNSGLVGAAIAIKNVQLSSSLSRLLNNPLCALRYVNPRVPPDLWPVEIRLMGNSAVVASAIHMNDLDLCSWRQYQEPSFNRRGTFRWDFIRYIRNVNRAHGNPLNQTFAVQTPPVGIRLSLDGVSAFPGETFGVGIFATDELNVPTTSVVRFLDDSTSSLTGTTKDKELYRLTPATTSLQQVSPCFRVSASYSVLTSSSSDFPREDISVRTVAAVNNMVNTAVSFRLNPQGCPPGRRLTREEGPAGFSACTCDIERGDIIGCNGRRILIGELLWGYSELSDADNTSTMMGGGGGGGGAMSVLMEGSGGGGGADNSSTQMEGDADEMGGGGGGEGGGGNDLTIPLHTFLCPFKYCRCQVVQGQRTGRCVFSVDHRVLDQQCHCNRTGVLCGACSEGSGFSALLNMCKSCDSSHAVLILVLVVADVVIVLTLLILMFPVPSWLYPAFFYLQLLPYLAEHFPVTFEKLRPFSVYIGSALGLYFPYDFCLHSNMPAVGVYSLRYIPALTVVLLAPVVLHIRIKKFRPCDWHGLWWLVLILYMPLLHTSFSLLNCPSLEGRGFTPRWYINANILCFQDPGHAVMGLFAIFVVCFCVSIIPFVTLVAADKLHRPHWVHCLVHALSLPYKPGFEWWCGVELGKRLFLVLLTVVVRPNDTAMLFCLVLLVSLNGFFKPYKNMLVNILDIVLAVDIFVLLALRNTTEVQELLHSIPDQNNNITTGLCSDIQGFSPFTQLLAPFYYFPFFLCLVAGGVWGVWHVSVWVRKKRLLPATTEVNLKRNPSSMLSPTPLPSHSLTQTVVDVNEMTEETPQERKSSFRERKSTFGSRFRWSKRHLAKSDSSKSKGVVNGEEIPLKEREAAGISHGGGMSPLHEVPTKKGSTKKRPLKTTVV